MAISGRIEAAPNRVNQHSPGPNPQIVSTDWRAAMKATRICAQPGCELPYRARGLCRAHYQSWFKATPRDMRPVPTMEERFHTKYSRGGSTQCWEWSGARHSFGYGLFLLNGKSSKASRVALMIATGSPAPEGKLACHRCDNPPCVNPKHLYWGSRQDNSDDAVSRGRIPLGQDRVQARLTEDQVVEIRNRYAAGEGPTGIAREFNVTVPTIRSISLGLKWKNAPGPISLPRRKK